MMKKVFSLEEIKKSQKINLIDGTYTHIRAYHACRPISIDDYLLNGIRPISYESALDEVKNRVVCEWVSENTAVEKFNEEWNDFDDIHKKVWLEMNKNLLLDGASHYLIYGSEFINALAMQPVRDVLDSKGNIVTKGNLVKINCESIISEEMWWKAYERRMGRSSKLSENIKGRKSGLRISADALGRKAYCSCGYCLSRQYTHVATENTSATYRYKCRWQVDHANKYTVGAAMKSDNIVCDNPAVSDVKLWLCEKNVFSYLFKNGKTAVLQAIELIERCKQEEDILEDGTSIQSLEEERDKLKKRLKNLQTMVMDELIDTNDFKEHKAEIDEQVSLIDRAIAQYEIDKAKREKKVFDLESIKERLNTFIDLKGYKVNEEMIDMFVERIIYRGIVNGNDEFLWVMNLSGEVTDTSAKYKIKGYDKAYSDSLMDDKNFNIVARMMIPMEECKRYCEKEADRKFRAKFWRPITIKIAIQ